MDAILAALEQQHSDLAALLDRLDDEDWERPTRCEGWNVADVVLHLAQTDELALASIEGRYADRLDLLAGGTDRAGTVDDGAAAIVAHGTRDAERGHLRAMANRRRGRTGRARGQRSPPAGGLGRR